VPGGLFSKPEKYFDPSGAGSKVLKLVEQAESPIIIVQVQVSSPFSKPPLRTKEACAEPLERIPTPNAAPRAVLVSEAELRRGRQCLKALLTQDDGIIGAVEKGVKDISEKSLCLDVLQGFSCISKSA
jgi:hypothetical protein